MTRDHEPFVVCLLEGATALGGVRMQLPAGDFGTIAELYDRFLTWVNAAERSPEERDRYFNRCKEIKEGTHTDWPYPIVLGHSKQIHDGKHRLIAAYAHSIATEPVRLHAFWGCPAGCPCH